MATVEEVLLMQQERMEEDRALMEAGYAPGEVPSEESLAALQAEILPEAEVEFQSTTGFVDPFAKYDEGPTADYDPFAKYDEPGREVVINPLETFPSDFPMEPGTSRASLELGEMFVPPELGGEAPQIQKGRTTPATGGGVGETLPLGQQIMVSAAALSMTDPEEIAGMLRQYPEDIGITYAPDGAIIATNLKTGARGLVNRPGAGMMDVLQGLGIMATYAPAGRAASMGVKTALPAVASATMRKQLEKKAVARAGTQMAAASAVTETGVQTGQVLAGGEFDPEDIAFAAVGAKAGEHLAKPIANLATKAKDIVVRKAQDIVPRSVSQALDYAERTGRKIYTTDALSEYMSPIQMIAMKTIERIPITGIGRGRARQAAARTDALVDLVNKYGIDIEKELGQDIADNFVTRMIKQRFWGKNKEIMDPANWPTGVTEIGAERRKAAQAQAQELLERAWKKESADVIDTALAKQLSQGHLDDEIVERILNQGIPKRVRDLYGKLLPHGQLAVKQRFLTKGLEKSGWTPDAPQIADPDQFVKYLSDPKNKKMMNIFFDQGERDLIEGTREYLRITAAAAKTSAGAGMVAAMGGGAAVGLALANGLFGIAAATAVVGRGIQGKTVRDLLLKLTYAKGDPKKAQNIMKLLRPAVMALESQYLESGGPPTMPDVDFNEEMMKDLGDYGMEYLRSIGETGMEKIEDVSGALSEMLN